MDFVLSSPRITEEDPFVLCSSPLLQFLSLDIVDLISSVLFFSSVFFLFRLCFFVLIFRGDNTSTISNVHRFIFSCQANKELIPDDPHLICFLAHVWFSLSLQTQRFLGHLLPANTLVGRSG